VEFIPYQMMHAVLLGEAFYQIALVLPYPLLFVRSEVTPMQMVPLFLLARM
jgi:hypothetical protein